ncbi:MAG: TonB C-terminal domain-containing protein [Parvibaculaceae bacterium]|nr:TonB C-terminal domain-containing protein [Parvibaculaceae bacterium]
MLAGGPVTAAGQGDAAGHGGRFSFDIPPQPLASALDSYSAITGREIFCDGDLVLGRRSSEVSGMLTPDAALKALLRDSGFVPRVTGPHSFTVMPAPQGEGTGPVIASSASDEYQRYFAAVQAGLRQAFCRNPETRPGTYRLVVKFWMAPSGAVQHSELLGSTGNRERDRAFGAALQTLRIAQPSPAGLPQPLTMAILPHTSGADECFATDARQGVD